MHLLCFHSSEDLVASSRRADRLFRSALVCPRVGSHCPALRPTTGWSTGLFVLARRQTSGRLSSSAVHALPRAARGIPRRMTLFWIPPLGDGSGRSFRRCFLGNSRRVLNQRWNGCVLQHPPTVLIVPCGDLLFAITDRHHRLYRTRGSVCAFLLFFHIV